MRKTKKETASTRERIVIAAAEKFRERGIDATGLSDLMGAVGMTHGGFYKHFASKEQIVQEAVRSASVERRNAFEAHARAQPQGSELAALITAYLSMDHCDKRGGGCLIAALGSEISRATDATKALTSEQFLAFVALIESLLAPTVADPHGRALAIASAMVGVLTLARIAPDPALARRVLDSGRVHILASWA